MKTKTENMLEAEIARIDRALAIDSAQPGLMIRKLLCLQAMGENRQSATMLDQFMFCHPGIPIPPLLQKLVRSLPPLVYRDGIFYLGPFAPDDSALSSVMQKTTRLIDLIIGRLAIEAPTVLIHIAADSDNLAFAATEGPDLAIVYLSDNMIDRPFFESVLIHELVHCCLRSKNRFLDEGIAVYFQYRYVCHHDFPFSHSDRAEALSQITTPFFSLQTLLDTHHDQALFFEHLTEDDHQARLIYLQADAFIGFLVNRLGFPGIVDLFHRVKDRSPDTPASRIVETVLGKPIDQIQAELFEAPNTTTDANRDSVSDVTPDKASSMPCYQTIATDIRRGRVEMNPKRYIHHAEPLRLHLQAFPEDQQAEIWRCKVLLLAALHSRLGRKVAFDDARWQEAQQCLDTLVRRLPDNPVVLLLSAEREVIRLLSTKWKMQRAVFARKAKRSLLLALKANPDEPECLIALAMLELNTPKEFGGSAQKGQVYLQKAGKNPLYTEEVAYITGRYVNRQNHTEPSTPVLTVDRPVTSRLRIEKLRIDQPPDRQLALDDIPLWAGEVVAIVGPNGVGKSTLLESLLGLRRTDVSQVYIETEPATQWLKQKAHRQDIGVLLQSTSYLTGMKVGEVLAFHSVLYPESDTEIYRAFDLGPLTKKFYHQLSRGQKQRVDLYMALAHHPRLILLDEPLTGLDAHYVQSFIDVITALTKSYQPLILIVSQRETELQLADRVLWLHNDRPAIIDRLENLIDRFLGTMCGTVQTRTPAELTAIAEAFSDVDAIGLRIRQGNRKLMLFGSDELEPLMLSRLSRFTPASYTISHTGAGDFLYFAVTLKQDDDHEIISGTIDSEPQNLSA
jgi:ABC-2 type transport system ATP-binding protein